MPDVARLYREGRERISDLVRDADTSTVVPACPQWTVKDVVAHLSGICADIIAGRLEGIATEPWTQRQVDERKGHDIATVLDEWSDAGAQVEGNMDSFPPQTARQLLADLTIHEHDLRGALGVPGARDSEAVIDGLAFVAEVVTVNVAPSFRLLTDEGEDVVIGNGEPTGTLRAPRFEMVRAFAGRRSEEQIAAFDWDGDYRDYVRAFNRGPFSLAASAILE